MPTSSDRALALAQSIARKAGRFLLKHQRGSRRIEFKGGLGNLVTDMDRASLEVRDKLETLRLPLEAEAPVLLRFNPSTEPVMRLVLADAGRSEDAAALVALRRYADEELKKQLEPVEGVAAVKAGETAEIPVHVTRTTVTLGARGQHARYDVMDRANPSTSGARRHTLYAWDVSARQAMSSVINPPTNHLRVGLTSAIIGHTRPLTKKM